MLDRPKLKLKRLPVAILIYVLRWFFIFCLLIVAINYKDPHLLPARHYESSVLVIFSVLGIAYYLRQDGVEQRFGLGALLLVITLTSFGEISSEYRKHNVTNLTGEGVINLGQHFIVGYENINNLTPLISKGLIGGIFITRRNARDKSITDLRNEISSLQDLRKHAGLPPLIIATDQEGGNISRLSPPLVKQPALNTLLNGNVDTALSELKHQAEIYGNDQGSALADLGVNLNFSPVVDLKSNRKSNLLDFHSQINQRAISADPKLTAEIANAYIKGLANQGVKATLKHFPGLGSVSEDTHHFSAHLDTESSQLEQHDWLPFKQISKETNTLIMLAHVILTKVDNANPVSSSKKVIQNIIRDNWKYNGILITDDLTMAAAYNRGFCQAVVNALNAGVDLLLVSYDYDKFYDAMYCVNQAYDDGSIDKSMIRLSQARLQQPFFSP